VSQSRPFSFIRNQRKKTVAGIVPYPFTE